MKDITNYEGLYAITSCGKVWSYKSKKFLKPYFNGGYASVALSKNGKLTYPLVHRLVAEAYISNPDNLPQVNHKDEDKAHNCVNNLEWCDATYNNNYGTRTSRMATALTGRTCSDSHKQHIREAKIGKKASPEKIKQQSESMKKYWAQRRHIDVERD